MAESREIKRFFLKKAHAFVLNVCIYMSINIWIKIYIHIHILSHTYV